MIICKLTIYKTLSQGSWNIFVTYIYLSLKVVLGEWLLTSLNIADKFQQLYSLVSVRCHMMSPIKLPVKFETIFPLISIHLQQTLPNSFVISNNHHCLDIFFYYRPKTKLIFVKVLSMRPTKLQWINTDKAEINCYLYRRLGFLVMRENWQFLLLCGGFRRALRFPPLKTVHHIIWT